MRSFLLVAALLGGCAQEQEQKNGRSDVIPIWRVPYLPAHSDETLDAASEILGLEFLDLDTTDPGGRHGGIELLEVYAKIDGIEGNTSAIDLCYPVSWATDNPHAVAHEVGHALGLAHSDDRDNLMWPDLTGGLELTEEQIDAMREFAWWLQHC